MQKNENYRGCSLDAGSNELQAGGYDAEVYIGQFHHGETLVTRFVLQEIFETGEAALDAVLEVGRQKVDIGFEPKFITSDIPAW